MGKRLLNTKALTVNLLVFGGFFAPLGRKPDTIAQRFTTLSGGPAVSLLLFLSFLVLEFAGFSFPSDILADGDPEFFLNFALFGNLFIPLLSVAPIHYFHGEIKGLETDGLQIIHILKRNRN